MKYVLKANALKKK